MLHLAVPSWEASLDWDSFLDSFFLMTLTVVRSAGQDCVDHSSQIYLMFFS